MQPEEDPVSPKWSTSTKVVVTLLFLTGAIALLIHFSSLLNTLITAFIIAVLYHPIAEWIKRKTKLPWAWSVSIIYFFTVLVVFGLLTVGGIALINQIDGLIKFLQNTLYELPNFFKQLTTTSIAIGPFKLDFSYINWDQVGNQLLTTIEPILTKVGNFFGGIATGTVGVIGSFLLSLLISFLVITETEGARDRIIKLEIPGYQEDFKRLGDKLNTIWNKFVRGQAIIFLARFVLYLVILSSLRLRFVLGMALLATLGNFIPYIGVAIVWIINFFVALFQGTTIFGLDPFPYAMIVMGIGWISDNLYDTFFAPRIMANVLKLHPAAVLVAVLVGLNLFGILGMFLAPPILASIKVLIDYSEKKLLDQDPWSNMGDSAEPETTPPFFEKIIIKVKASIKKFFENRKHT
ncbi:MAG: AI-2E family transporter [Pelolinea sp.]|nr:AI-2E family transporter [Pelolinea sp.]